MASPPTSSVAFLTPAGEPLARPQEWVPCLVAVPVDPAQLQDVVVERNGQPLVVTARALDGAVRVVAEWPRSGTGAYAVTVRCPPAGLDEHVVTTVEPAKLSEAAYAQLLEDLELRLPASIAIALRDSGALTGIELLPPAESTLAQELLRLRRAVRGVPGRPGLAGVLTRLARDPHQALVSTEVWVPRERVRRLAPARLPQLLTRGGNLTAERQPRRVPEIRVDHTPDTYENRVVRTFHDQVSQRIRLLQRAKRIPNAAAAELAALRDELQRARRAAAFLDDTGQLVRAPTEMTMVLLKRAEYRAALEGFLEFRRSSVVRLDEAALESPLENLPSLYETWGVLHVIDAVLAEAPHHGFETPSERLSVRDPSGLFIRLLRDGTSALECRHPRGHVLRVIPQRTYSSTSEPHRSMSFGQKPDVVIELVDPDGKAGLWIFDPKYKLASEDATSDDPPDGRPKKLDIDAMHAYRDALRDGDGRRVVRYAAILYPGPSKSYGKGLAAIRAHPADGAALTEQLRAVIASCLARASADDA